MIARMGLNVLGIVLISLLVLADVFSIVGLAVRSSRVDQRESQLTCLQSVRKGWAKLPVNLGAVGVGNVDLKAGTVGFCVSISSPVSVEACYPWSDIPSLGQPTGGTTTSSSSTGGFGAASLQGAFPHLNRISTYTLLLARESLTLVYRGWWRRCLGFHCGGLHLAPSCHRHGRPHAH